MTDISVIILSYNTKELTEKCIETIIKSIEADSDIKTEIIVLDNNSTDGSAQMLRGLATRYSKLVTIFSKKNLGFAKGNNEAVTQANGDVLLFLNSDTNVVDNAIPVLYKYYTSRKNPFNFVGGKLLERDAVTPQPSCGPFYSLPVVFAALFLRGDYWGLTRWSPEKIKEVDWVSGACIMCRSKDFEKLGGFDEAIFMYMDEIDLLYRAKTMGMRVGFYPIARFVHLGSASSSGRTHPILQVYRGFKYFYKKHKSPLQRMLLRGMLQLKALIALAIGYLTDNNYLKTTYGEALKIAQKD